MLTSESIRRLRNAAQRFLADPLCRRFIGPVDYEDLDQAILGPFDKAGLVDLESAAKDVLTSPGVRWLASENDGVVIELTAAVASTLGVPYSVLDRELERYAAARAKGLEL